MIPDGFPGVIRDGIHALEWASKALESALPKVSDWVAHLAPSKDKAIADAVEAAKREKVPFVAISWPDARGWSQAWTEQRRDLEDLANRLKHRSKDEWTSGGAATFFTGVDVALLQNWQYGGNTELLRWLGEEANEIHRRKAEFAAVAKWLANYLDENK